MGGQREHYFAGRGEPLLETSSSLGKEGGAINLILGGEFCVPLKTLDIHL